MIHQNSAKTTKVFSHVAFVVYGNLVIPQHYINFDPPTVASYS